MTDTIVVAGAGHAASELAFCLRQQGHAGRIVLVGDEPHLPYQRPPLSKAFLAGSSSRDKLFLRPQSAYDRVGIELRLGCAAGAIDRAGKRLVLADGSAIAYGKLALALGGQARRLQVAGDGAVHTLRTIADVERLQQQFHPGKRLVIIGGGYVGLEVAAVAIQHGLAVTLLEAAGRVLERVAAPAISAFYQHLHAQAGVDIRTGVTLSAIEQGPDCVVVSCADGARIEADFVIAGVGLVPNTTLAAEAGLAVRDGIVVDELMRTSDPDIVAIGDCANHASAFAGRRIRLESVQNAVEMARSAAATLCDKEQPYQVVPWFWSDQYQHKLQMAGLSQGHDEVVLRGSFESASVICFYLRGGRVVAADAVNRAADFMHARRLIASGATPRAAQLADDSVPLKAVL